MSIPTPMLAFYIPYPTGLWYKYVPLETSNFVAIWYVISHRGNDSFSKTPGRSLANILHAVLATCSCALFCGFVRAFLSLWCISNLLLCSVLRIHACNSPLCSISNLLLCSVLWVCACNSSPFRIGNLLLCSVLKVCACNLSLFPICDLLLYSVCRILMSS